MKIAIASDIHDNLANLERFLEIVKKEKVKTLVLCGDLCGKEVLEFLEKNFDGKIYSVLGNADKEEILDLDKNSQKIKIFKNFGEIKIERLKICFSHHIEMAKEKLKDCDFIFYGHSHKPWLEKMGKCTLVNPGNLTGLFYKPTFAVLNTKTKKN